MTGPDLAREALSTLSSRLARGEIDETAFLRQRELVLSNLTPAERAEMGFTPTPAPGTPPPAPVVSGYGTPPPFSPLPLGPSGGKGRAVATRVASLSDLDLRPGTVLFDKWRIERELGRGGFGVVVEAEELRLRKRQAVKVLDPAMVARPDLLERFRREVNATRELVHPRIVRVFDYDENLAEGLALFSMELVKGCSVQLLLAAARETRTPVPVPLALTVLLQVLEALEAAHAQGVIHRDITPANVLLAGGAAKDLLADPSRDPQVKLVDFGIAGALERSELSQKSRVLGTAAYVAPEVLDPHVEVTPAADVYGAGAVFYELLTGKAPLGRFLDPSKVRPGLAPRVDAFSLSLLETEPSARPTAAKARQGADEALLGEARDRDEERRREAERQRRAEAAARAAEESARAEQARRAEEARKAEEARREAAERVRRAAPAPPPIPQPARQAAPAPAAAPPPKPTSAAVPVTVLAVVLGVAAVIGWVATRPARQAGPAEAPAVVEEPAAAPATDAAPAATEAALATIGLRWVTIPAGTFTMGCTPGDDACQDDEKPAHRVTLTKGFRMAATETTNGQYRACVDAGACTPPSDRTAYDKPSKRDYPVMNVSWEDAAKFCRWAGGRLPTEAEWEYAARGGRDGNRYPWGNEIAGSNANYRRVTAFVGSCAATGYGLYDMVGNVWEWCADWYDGSYYGKSPLQDPKWPSSGIGRVVRGGSSDSYPSRLRVSNRFRFDPSVRDVYFGFRCVRDASSP